MVELPFTALNMKYLITAVFCAVYALFMAPFSEGGKVTTNMRGTAGMVLQSNQQMFLTRTFIRLFFLLAIRGF